MKWYFILLIIGAITLIIGGAYMTSKQIVNLMGESKEQVSKYDTFDSIGSGSRLVTKDYISKNETIVIKDVSGNTLLDLRLTTPKKNVIAVGGMNTLVAEFYLEEFLNLTSAFSDSMEFYDLNNKNQSVTRQSSWRYGTYYNTTECLDDNIKSSCSITTDINWTEFNKLSEIPSKQVRIGLFVDTYLDENIEWVMNTNGFRISEWAEWDITTAVNTANKSLTANGQGVFINSSGTGMYVTTAVGNNLLQYYLSTPWDVTTAVNTANKTTLSDIPTDVFINSSGTGMYLGSGTSPKVLQYYLSTPWDITTATNTDNFTLSGSTGVTINSSGTGMYTQGSATTYQYLLSTPWLVSSAVSIVNLTNPENAIEGININDSGTGMYLVGRTNDNVYQYSLSTPWLISSATNTANLSILGQDTNMRGIFLNSSGTGMYLAGQTGKKVYQYNMAPTPPAGGNCWFQIANGDTYVPNGCDYYITSEVYEP